MEIESIYLKSLRNEEHYKFNIDFSALVAESTPEALGIQTLYPAYQLALTTEISALNVVQGIAITDDLIDADAVRDTTFRGLTGTVKSALNHFDPEVRSSAERLKMLIDTYGNMTEKPLDQETASIIKLVEELEGSYAADAVKLGVASWVTALKQQNKAFDDLKNLRYDETTAKPQLNLRQARQETDNAYRAIIKRINSLIEVNGPTAYSAFVADLNSRVGNYQNLLEQRKSRNAKAKAKESESTGEGESVPKK